MVSLNVYITRNGLTQNRQNSANTFGRNSGFKIENEIKDQGQSIPKSTGNLAVLRCIFGQNLDFLNSIGGMWSHGQHKVVLFFYFKLNFTLKVNVNRPTKIGILNKVFYASDANLAILVWAGEELLHGEAREWCAHTQTDASNNNT